MTTQTLPIYQIDAFTDMLFAGNPAAVIPLSGWLADDVLQKIAMENNLSETAFFVPCDDKDEADFHIRWFTPTVEVPLCGHATLASAFVIFNHLGFKSDLLKLQSKSGILTARRDHDAIVLDFPKQPIKANEIPQEVLTALGGAKPVESYVVASRDTDIVAVYDNAKIVRDMAPDMSVLGRLTGRGVIVTAPGDKTGLDMISRFFVPAIGINEDPVTGSAHCLLTPFWAERLGKTQISAEQASARGGRLGCALEGDRVILTGACRTVIEGRFLL